MGTPGQPLVVDYSTGYMLMDVQVSTDWILPSVRPQDVPRMLYLDANNRILALATKKSNGWPKELTMEYNAVKLELSKMEGMMLDGAMMPGGEGLPPDMTTRIQDAGRL
jgi:hypothetical protein